GNVASRTSYTHFYLSVDRSRTSSDVRAGGTSVVGSLAAGASATNTITVTVPTSTRLATYFVLACADDTGTTVETDETNNCRASATTVEVTRPDLVETSVSDPPATAVRGSAFIVTDSVQNQGRVASKASRSRYYLSADQRKAAGDTLLGGSRLVPALGAGATSTQSVSVTIPTSIAAGAYYVIACADDGHGIVELDESNNCRPSVAQIVVR